MSTSDQRGAKTRGLPLPEAELEVLARLHQLGEAPASTIRAELHKLRPLKHASVMTLLGRLEAKGLVAKRKADAGKAFIFFPTRAAEETYQNAVGRMVERIFSNDPVALVSSLFGAKKPTRAQVRRLQELVDELHPEQEEQDR